MIHLSQALGRVVPIGTLTALASLTLLALLVGCAPHAPVAPDFTLTGDGGRPWTLSAQRGRVVLLTFGFSRCADTCPTTLAKLAHVVRATAMAPGAVEIAMVTVDPRRDTPRVLHRFVKHFNGPVVGLTGTPAQIAAVESAYHIWAQRIPAKHANARDYDIAHTADIVAIDARGEIRAIRNDDESDAALTGIMRQLID